MKNTKQAQKNFSKFIKVAKGHRVHVDVDGTILKSFEIPQDVQGNKFVWWNENLDKTARIYSRLVLCIILKIFGSELVVWTNRSQAHAEITKNALGIFQYIFSDFQFFCGEKSKSYNDTMFVIDDDVRYRGLNTLTVEKI